MRKLTTFSTPNCQLTIAIFLTCILPVTIFSAPSNLKGPGGKGEKDEAQEQERLKTDFRTELYKMGFYDNCTFGALSKGTVIFVDAAIVESNGNILLSTGTGLKMFGSGELKAEKGKKKTICKWSLCQRKRLILSDGKLYEIGRGIQVTLTIVDKKTNYEMGFSPPLDGSYKAGYDKNRISLHFSLPFDKQISPEEIFQVFDSVPSFSKASFKFFGSLPEDMIITPDIIYITDNF